MEEIPVEIKSWIEKQRIKGIAWDSIMLANKMSLEGLAQFLVNQNEDNDWPDLTVEDWQTIVEGQRLKENANKAIIDDSGASVIADNNETNNLTIPTGYDSAWQTYKRKLAEKGFPEQTISIIQDATIKTLRNLSRDTHDKEAVKGLVVGNVQSGKTANMAALMAMASDYGWNMFIILSGMMNNLKRQTISRILSDLKGSKWDWRPVHDPSSGSQDGERARDLDWGEASRQRYLSVCIKNSYRLKDLLNWINYTPDAKEKIRLLIIDDESDQASINASKRERSAINTLLLDLVNNRTGKHVSSKSQAQAINYVGYTATPYANILNETPGKESLYPKNFITALSVSDEYFGPQQIFGYQGDDAENVAIYPGLDIVRNISDADESEINDIHTGTSELIPDSLKASIAWFLCGIAAMRLRNYRKPISMLVHTSRDKKHHEEIRDSINMWFASTAKSKKIELCRKLWEEESARFTEQDLFDGYPNYCQSAGGANIIPNPSFEQILPYLENLLDEGLKNILVNSDDMRLEYSTGVHICVDNSNTNDDDTIQTRLMYPEENEMPNVAPAFLVIGGNTLSRGLTLEGLISTYFLRPARCADTLMQMGRWFGYRRGYELLPRIWMPQQTRAQFEFMAEMDQRLRDEIRHMEKIGVSPSDCGPKIMASPSTKFLQIVSANKSQSAIPSTYDFSGHTMETGVFSKKEADLNANLSVTKKLLNELGEPINSSANPYANNNFVWRNIHWEVIRKYLENYRYSHRLKSFKEVEPLLSWFDDMTAKGEFGDWNVILAGKGASNKENRWEVSENIAINKIQRTQITPDRADGSMNIKVLRSFNDFLSDIQVGSDDFELLDQMSAIKHNLSSLNMFREQIGAGSTPQLVIYIIDKDSKPEDNSKTRYPLNSPQDVAGFSINIPGYRDNLSTISSWTINIPKKNDTFAHDENL